MSPRTKRDFNKRRTTKTRLIAAGVGLCASVHAVDLDPVLVGQWPGYDRGPVNAVAISGNDAFVAAGGLQVLDISNPANPKRVGGCDTKEEYWYELLDVAVSGGYAYVADSSGLQVIDISRPADPQRIASVTNFRPYSVVVSGRFAYTAGYTPDETGTHYALHVVDISDPTHPRMLGETECGEAFGLAVSGSYVYLAEYEAGLRVIDVSDPAQPHTVSTRATGGYAVGVEVCEDPHGR